MPANIPSVVFIGGGPRTAGVLERLAANRPELFAGPLEIHVVEPHDPGSGRIWRYDQHPGLLLNSVAADITMFTDASVACEGPAADGPGTRRVGRRRPGRLHHGRSRTSRRTSGNSCAPSPAPRSPPASCRASTSNGSSAGPSSGARTAASPSTGPPPSRDRVTPPCRVRRPVRTSCGWPTAARCDADVVVTALGHTDSLPDAASAGLGRLRRPARRLPRGTQLHHRRRLFTHRPRPGRDRRRHGTGVRGPAGPPDGRARRPV